MNGFGVTPDSFGPGVANFYVDHCEIDDYKKGILHVRGADDSGSGAWQLAGTADVDQTYRLFYRHGMYDTWEDWKEIAFLDSTVLGAYMLMVDDQGAPNVPVYFKEGVPVSTEYDLHTLIRPHEPVQIPNVTNLIIADKLSTDRGTASHPIYIKDGLPELCSNTLSVNISGNAYTATAFENPITLRVALGSSSKSSPLYGTDNIHDIGVNGILPVQHGGTGAAYAAVPGGVMFGRTVAAYECSAAGSSGQLLTSGGTGAPTWLSDDVGSENNPVYIEGGVVKPCKTTLSVTAATSKKVTVNDDTPSKLYVLGATETGSTSIYRESSVYMESDVLYGAAWNDYAEFRMKKENVAPGYCVASTNSGEVYKTTERLQACDGVVSDTYGFIIGDTSHDEIPLAVAGRVLAYCEGDRNDFNSGDTVAAGPEGKVVKMTRDEIRNYPDRIVGIVSEIPTYETWGSGNVKVNGRIWIKIK